MTGCRATLTTVTTTDDVAATGGHDPWGYVIPDGTAVVRDGDRLLRLDVTTLTCVGGKDHLTPYLAGVRVPHLGRTGERWYDDTPGAASHADNTDLLTTSDRSDQ